MGGCLTDVGSVRPAALCCADRAVPGADGGGVLPGDAAQPHPGHAQVCLLLRPLLVSCSAVKLAQSHV